MSCIDSACLPSGQSKFILKSIVSAIALAASSHAAAQEVAPANAAPPLSDAAAQEIVVTGSRLGRSTFTTPNPVTVLNSEDIEKLGLTNVGDIVAQLPSNSNFFAANNVGLGNFNVGAQLVNLRGLNPFFGTRTLTLVDTRRVVPTTTGGGVDITLIPSILVARTETVTGGASAVYGSDAVAGVLNIILDTQLKGFKATADYSLTTRGDGGDAHAAAAYGNRLRRRSRPHRRRRRVRAISLDRHLLAGARLVRRKPGLLHQSRQCDQRPAALHHRPERHLGQHQPHWHAGALHGVRRGPASTSRR